MNPIAFRLLFRLTASADRAIWGLSPRAIALALILTLIAWSIFANALPRAPTTPTDIAGHGLICAGAWLILARLFARTR
jgi:hypothetical protein